MSQGPVISLYLLSKVCGQAQDTLPTRTPDLISIQPRNTIMLCLSGGIAIMATYPIQVQHASRFALPTSAQ